MNKQRKQRRAAVTSAQPAGSSLANELGGIGRQIAEGIADFVGRPFRVKRFAFSQADAQWIHQTFEQLNFKDVKTQPFDGNRSGVGRHTHKITAVADSKGFATFCSEEKRRHQSCIVPPEPIREPDPFTTEIQFIAWAVRGPAINRIGKGIATGDSTGDSIVIDEPQVARGVTDEWSDTICMSMRDHNGNRQDFESDLHHLPNWCEHHGFEFFSQPVTQSFTFKPGA